MFVRPRQRSPVLRCAIAVWTLSPSAITDSSLTESVSSFQYQPCKGFTLCTGSSHFQVQDLVILQMIQASPACLPILPFFQGSAVILQVPVRSCGTFTNSFCTASHFVIRTMPPKIWNHESCGNPNVFPLPFAVDSSSSPSKML